MNFDNYTERSRGFVQAAQTIAVRENHQRFTPEHILKALLDDEDIHYFEDPRRDVVLINFQGLLGSYQLTICLDVDGELVGFRTFRYAYCPTDSQHLPELLQLLATLNLITHWVKWAWDVSDGEVVAMGDIWVMDTTLTQEQFRRMLANILQAIDLESQRIKTVIETGLDPGERDIDELVKTAGDSDEPIREL